MMKWLMSFAGDPGLQIFTLAVFALTALAVALFLELTESRRGMRQAISFFKSVIVWIAGMAIILIFVRQYIPCFTKPEGLLPPVIGVPEFGSIVSDRDFYHDCFSDLLTVLSVVGTVFGLLVPIGSYLLQRNSLKDEADVFRSEMNAKNEDVANKQAGISEDIKSLKRDMTQVKESSAGWVRRMKDHARVELESMKSNMACLNSIYISNSVPEEAKVDLIQHYLYQFVCYLRCVESDPGCGAQDADVYRFCDAMKKFRKDHAIYSVAVKFFRQSMEGDECTFLGAVQPSYGSSAYGRLCEEIHRILPQAA